MMNMKKKYIYLTAAALAASQLLGVGCVNAAEGETEFFFAESTDDDLTAAEEGFTVVEDPDQILAKDDAYDAHLEAVEDVLDEISDSEGITDDSIGLIEEMEDTLGTGIGDDLNDELLTAASDQGSISADGNPVNLGSDSILDYTLTVESTGEYHLIGTGVQEFTVFDKVTEDEIAGVSADIPDQTDAWFHSVRLTGGKEYIVRVRHLRDGAGSFYCYLLPRFCVVIPENSYPTGSDYEDLNLKKRIYYNDSSSYFDTDLLDEWNYCVDKGCYFRISMTGALEEIVNGDTSSVAFSSPDYGHGWDEGTVTKQPTCGSEGTLECHCVCGQREGDPKIVNIPRTNNHSWSAYNANGDRSCTVCGAKQHDASKVKPVYQIDSKPAKVKVKAPGGRKLTVTWKKPSKSKLKKIQGYYIEVATDKAFTNIVKTKTVKKKKTTFTFKKLKKKQKYYVRVRFYKRSQISQWSAVRGKKVK